MVDGIFSSTTSEKTLEGIFCYLQGPGQTEMHFSRLGLFLRALVYENFFSCVFLET